MTVLSSIVDPLISAILPGITAAVLTVMGALLTLVVGVWGSLHLIARIRGKDSAIVFYQMGRLFGDLVYEDGYRKYKAGRDKDALNASYRARYNRTKP